ncbi:MAG: prolyl oligopeptidase family serine peptidase [Myxococcota bacterium]|nr:prolyl oligopeptidase family serine peptidase [Myxococcota bacterium]
MVGSSCQRIARLGRPFAPAALSLLGAIGCSGSSVHSSSPRVAVDAPRYPRTPRTEANETRFGSRVEDPYRWLEPTDDASVRAWSVAQDELARGILSRLPLRELFRRTLRELRATDEVSPPVARGKRLFYTRRGATDDLPCLFMQPEPDGKEVLVLDPKAWSEDGSLTFGNWWVSPDGTKIAYQLRTNGHDAARIRVVVVADGASRPVAAADDIADGEDPRPQWLSDGSGFYYTAVPADGEAATRWSRAGIRLHRLGDPTKADTTVFAPVKDETDQSCGLSEDGHWLTVTVSFGWANSRVYVGDLRGPTHEFRPVEIAGEAKTNAIAYRDRLFVYTEENAPNGRIVSLDPASPRESDAREIIAERPAEPLLGFSILGGKLVLSYLVDVATEVEIRELDGRPRTRLRSPPLSTVFRPVGRDVDDVGYFTVQSYASPPVIYRFTASTGDAQPWFETRAPFAPADFVTERLFVASTGGARVPMFVIRRKDAALSPSTPLILEGYGGFREVNRPLYRPDVVAWVKWGGAYAIACIRGGGEYGESWHQSGMLHNKQNAFDDFLAAADALVERGYTSRKHLVLRGASNGGLLVAATITERPDVAAAALLGEPLTDMIRFARFGAAGTAEYGNPDREDDFRALLAYSPYHRVVQGRAYPAVLVTAAETDERAHPMHARKFVAALQQASIGGSVLLRMDFRYAHAGATLISAWVDKIADELSFAAWQTH